MPIYSQVNRYFKYPYYDLPAASYGEEYKQAFGIGEFLTIADGDFDASRFTGAALVSSPTIASGPAIEHMIGHHGQDRLHHL